jgi:hypothetical protein
MGWFSGDFWIIAALIAGSALVSELGYRAGVRLAPRYQPFRGQFDVVRAATFALVGFLIAFSFSGAATRFIDRLDIIVTEANALGTAWLRADLLPDPQRGQLKAAIREYTQDRVTLLSTDDDDEIRLLLAKVGGLHARMWSAATSGGAGDMMLMNLVLPPLNDVIDLHASHYNLALRRLPGPILVVLLATAALSLLLVSVGDGLSGRRLPLLDGIYALVLSVSLWMTIDLDYPRQGLIQVDSQPMVDALAAMK